ASTPSTSTTAVTQAAKAQPSRRESRRACACAPKKSIPAFSCAGSGEAHLRGFTLLGRRAVEHLRGLEAEPAGNDGIGEHLARVVIAHHRVVEGLAREGDAILGGGELFGELHH